jgi:hypothetical protein
MAWKKAKGRVLEKRITTEKGEDNLFFYPYVRYEYVVDGKRFISDRVTQVHVGSGTPDFAKRTLEQFKVGRSTIVYYNTNDPEDAYLIGGIGSVFTPFLTQMAIICVVLVLLVLYFVPDAPTHILEAIQGIGRR